MKPLSDEQMLSKLKYKLQNIFGQVYSLHLNKKYNQLTFEIKSNLVRFGNLQKLSELLGTDAIDFAGKTRVSRYSSWTSDTEEYAEITVYNMFEADILKAIEK